MASNDVNAKDDQNRAGESAEASDTHAVEQLVAGGGSYDLLKSRLTRQGQALLGKVQQLNEARVQAFGRSEQSLLLRTRARTDNNCVARDMVRIGDVLLWATTSSSACARKRRSRMCSPCIGWMTAGRAMSCNPFRWRVPSWTTCALWPTSGSCTPITRTPICFN